MAGTSKLLILRVMKLKTLTLITIPKMQQQDEPILVTTSLLRQTAGT